MAELGLNDDPKALLGLTPVLIGLFLLMVELALNRAFHNVFAIGITRTSNLRLVVSSVVWACVWSFFLIEPTDGDLSRALFAAMLVAVIRHSFDTPCRDPAAPSSPPRSVSVDLSLLLMYLV